MHKKIVEAIKKSLKHHSDEGRVKIFVNDKLTGGFWQMIVIVKKDHECLLPHIKTCGYSIGVLHGEYLAMSTWENTISFS